MLAFRRSLSILAMAAFPLAAGAVNSWIPRPAAEARAIPGQLLLSGDPDIAYAVDPGVGLQRSDDGGRHWRKIESPDRGTLEIDPADPERLFLATSAISSAAPTAAAAGPWPGGPADLRAPAAVLVSRHFPGRVYAATRDALWQSTDGGASFGLRGALPGSPAATPLPRSPKPPTAASTCCGRPSVSAATPGMGARPQRGPGPQLEQRAARRPDSARLAEGGHPSLAAGNRLPSFRGRREPGAPAFGRPRRHRRLPERDAGRRQLGDRPVGARHALPGGRNTLQRSRDRGDSWQSLGKLPIGAWSLGFGEVRAGEPGPAGFLRLRLPRRAAAERRRELRQQRLRHQPAAAGGRGILAHRRDRSWRSPVPKDGSIIRITGRSTAAAIGERAGKPLPRQR